jgi:hypothetical protein
LAVAGEKVMRRTPDILKGFSVYGGKGRFAGSNREEIEAQTISAVNKNYSQFE